MREPDVGKAALRATARAARRRSAPLADAPGSAPLGALLAERVLALLPATATTVATYAAVGREPPTAGLVAALHARGLQVLLPVVLPDLDLDWAQDDGVRRPGPDGPHVPEPGGARLGPHAVARADVVVAPALLVDRAGRRLGQGGGELRPRPRPRPPRRPRRRPAARRRASSRDRCPSSPTTGPCTSPSRRPPSCACPDPSARSRASHVKSAGPPSKGCARPGNGARATGSPPTSRATAGTGSLRLRHRPSGVHAPGTVRAPTSRGGQHRGSAGEERRERGVARARDDPDASGGLRGRRG
nr:5-formyltetrahydrofolate cyclo-ligase [Angustibacter aerolatus]